MKSYRESLLMVLSRLGMRLWKLGWALCLGAVRVMWFSLTGLAYSFMLISYLGFWIFYELFLEARVEREDGDGWGIFGVVGVLECLGLPSIKVIMVYAWNCELPSYKDRYPDVRCKTFLGMWTIHVANLPPSMKMVMVYAWKLWV